MVYDEIDAYEYVFELDANGKDELFGAGSSVWTERLTTNQAGGGSNPSPRSARTAHTHYPPTTPCDTIVTRKGEADAYL